MKFKPVIKWSGSKRGQSEQIVSYFPKNIEIYYEPFIGGGSVLYQLINTKDIKVNKFVCSDINDDLIKLWNIIQKEPLILSGEYEKRWSELNNKNDIKYKNEYYYKIRDNFNKDKNLYDFFFLIRTCFNGLIRYNSKGEFNSPFHFSRPGIKPDKLNQIILEWSNKIKDVEFRCCSYKEIQGKKGDYIYLDPPYAGTKAMYYGKIDYNEYWSWLRQQKCDYALSFDGISGENNYTYNIPLDLYSNHYYMKKEISGFKKMNNKQEYVQESLYLK